ncbi:MAG: hypothetical protein C0473_01805 [Cyanobacteria bacterium DS3.002]|nr:hypothetical protein [Cyanobacteria bacterium DS3.002]
MQGKEKTETKMITKTQKPRGWRIFGLTRMEMPVKVVQSETTRVVVQKLFYQIKLLKYDTHF